MPHAVQAAIRAKTHCGNPGFVTLDLVFMEMFIKHIHLAAGLISDYSIDLHKKSQNDEQMHGILLEDK